MQSLLSSAKLFCCAIFTAVFVSFFATLATAQVYQIQPNRSLMYQPRYVNPNLQQPNAVPQIYPGQIINGERVVGTTVTSPPLNRGEAVAPPKPPMPNSDQTNQNPSQTNQQSPSGQRTDKLPKTNLPIPAGPALQSEPEVPPAPAEAVSKQTLKNSESSLAKEENSNQSQDKSSSANPQPDDLLPLEPPITETSKEDELALDQPAIDEIEKMAEIDEDIMDEIKQIRAQLGGGISETLKDMDQMPNLGAIEITSAEDETGTTSQGEISPEDLFNEELRSVISGEETNDDVLAMPQSPRTVQTPPTVGAHNQTQTTYDDRTEQLRTCARELEQIAGRLENIEAYEHADQLRRQAAEIWTTARKSK